MMHAVQIDYQDQRLWWNGTGWTKSFETAQQLNELEAERKKRRMEKDGLYGVSVLPYKKLCKIERDAA